MLVVTRLTIFLVFQLNLVECDGDDLKVTILHLNDFHAHIEQTNEKLMRCRPGKSDFPRVAILMIQGQTK